VILSRKGFDSGKSGGHGQSPVIGRRMVSLPIPEERRASPVRYGDLHFGGLTYADLLASLYPTVSHDRAHLDPYLVPDLRGRPDGAFRGLFGQSGASAAHLRTQGVDHGDLFLFFGRFKRAERDGDGYRFVRGARSFHAIWGYLEVGEVIVLDGLSTADRSALAVPWAREFPHFYARSPMPKAESVYVAAARLRDQRSRPGFGVFRYRDELRLTAAGSPRLTDWQLPSAFDGVRLSYNAPTPARPWVVDGEHVAFRAASIGQEFVAEATPEIQEWANDLIVSSESWQASEPLD
jgi:hypothetical protein